MSDLNINRTVGGDHPDLPVIAEPSTTSARRNTTASSRLPRPANVPSSSLTVPSSGTRQPVRPAPSGSASRTAAASAEASLIPGEIDTAKLDKLTDAKNKSRPYRAKLSTIGLTLPAMVPQMIGHYAPAVIGAWPATDRTRKMDCVLMNLKTLAEMPAGTDKAKQLHREITVHWHGLSLAEMSDVLNKVGPTITSKANGKRWLEHTAAHMAADDVTDLLKACDPGQQVGLAATFGLAGTDAARKAQVKSDTADMRMTLPMDHLFDYTGLMEKHGWNLVRFPEGSNKPKSIGVIAGGPAGLTIATLANHAGIKVTVLEAEDHIGGRLATHRRDLEDGTKSPTETHPGGMRFHTTHGNLYWHLVEKFELEHIDFVNPSQVGATLLVGNDVLRMEPGREPDSEVLRKVRDDFNHAIGSLTQPLRDARDAGNVPRFLMLSQAAKEKFDGHTFETGVKLLLKENGHEWTDEHWEKFGAVGIGVGGYKGYFNTGFLEEFRFLVDQRLEGHQLLVKGADEPLRRMVAEIPQGGKSLGELGAIQLNTRATGVDKVDGQYVVKAQGPDGEQEHKFDELFFAAPPGVAVKLGLTEEVEGKPRLVSPEIATALKRANIVGATKMTMTVPAADFHPGMLPKNVQTTALFQQLYLQPPAEVGKNAVIYLSYTLGENAKKVEGMSKDEQIDLLLKDLEQAQKDATNPTDKAELGALATVITNYRDRTDYTHWSEKNGAFKMDGPGDLANSRVLYGQTLKPRDEPYFVNEMTTYEAGFASGAIAASINAFQAMARRRGAILPANSPLAQKLL
ncbi:FAD-dependent oxidoreductase [Paraburkholderia sediminicola]|uniref:Tryptophan 2-monooxygenase n=1 Tax=Paraburkholderia metrosideri TaxID=580937 RepID=A0ABW9DPA5_9BURK